jgi:hypothetical protein
MPTHSDSAEKESLKLVEDFVGALTHALASCPQAGTLLAKYRFASSKHLQRAIEGFAFLRQSKRVDASKFLVRPALEVLIRLEAASKHPDLFYRIAFSEHLRDEQLLRLSDELSNDNARSEENWKTFKENWQRFSDAFTKEFPNVPKVDKELTVAAAAEKAELKPFYGSHYRIYSQYTHGALRASVGSLDQATDPEDNRIMAVCALGALETLVSLGAKWQNRDDLIERLQRLSPSETGKDKRA